jgi:hypothetical protein
MSDKQHKELRAGMLCIIAFAIGAMVFLSGCSVGNMSRAKAFNHDIEVGGGLYIEGERNGG